MSRVARRASRGGQSITGSTGFGGIAQRISGHHRNSNTKSSIAIGHNVRQSGGPTGIVNKIGGSSAIGSPLLRSIRKRRKL